MYYVSKAKCKTEDGIKGAGVGGPLGKSFLQELPISSLSFILQDFAILMKKFQQYLQIIIMIKTPHMLIDLKVFTFLPLK